ncbi:MAG: hypothetical protein J2P57_07310 [Acidimicrobiaceae bacterium]|nr:hypothetical protein [Acidimicrobiaceae bacterium]
MRGFSDLAVALGSADRIPFLLPSIDRGLFRLDGMAAAARVKVGADVLPWWPLTGVYLLVERGAAPASDLVDVPGVAGAWWGAGFQLDPTFSTADGRPMSTSDGLHITYCFLDDDPVATASRMPPVLQKRRAEHDVVTLLAAPFHPVSGHDWDRHLP